MSNQPNKSHHRASFSILDESEVSETEDRVRVQVEVSPSRWGYLSSVITLVVPRASAEGEIRKAVCRKVLQETGLTYLPDELHSPIAEASSLPGEMEIGVDPGWKDESVTARIEIKGESVKVLDLKRTKRKGRK